MKYGNLLMMKMKKQEIETLPSDIWYVRTYFEIPQYIPDTQISLYVDMLAEKGIFKCDDGGFAYKCLEEIKKVKKRGGLN